ncbi:hypothetical protein ASF29_00910 [Rhizobium sp. Leaf262]|nr:hypothetical protein ASF29_00910 [Rhizobium sp. Leaf262]
MAEERQLQYQFRRAGKHLNVSRRHPMRLGPFDQNGTFNLQDAIGLKSIATDKFGLPKDGFCSHREAVVRACVNRGT